MGMMSSPRKTECYDTEKENNPMAEIETMRHNMSRTTKHNMASPHLSTAIITDTLENSAARAAGAVGLAAIGLIHLLDAPGKLSETPYMFWMYLLLIAGCLGGATLLLRGNSRLAWLAAAVLSIMPFLGYVFSRTTGLPGATGDIGNWTEPLGLASLFVEVCVFAMSVSMLSQLRERPLERQR